MIDLAGAAEILNRFPEIRWDRLVEEDGDDPVLVVYGWIARDDARSDFVVFKITDDLRVGFVTSSARYSASISDRLYGDHDDHDDCQRVEEFFGALVVNAVRTSA